LGFHKITSQKKCRGKRYKIYGFCSAVVGESLQKITGLQHTSQAAERHVTLYAYPQLLDLSPLIIQVKIT
jgi:hypothetical protein